MKFQAAILAKSKEDLVIDEIEIPDPLKEGQVLVQIERSGICGAQINEIDAVKGQDKFLPHLLGHEGVGTVIEIGKNVRHVKVNDRVILHWRPGNGIQAETYKYRWKNRELNSGWVTTFSQYTVVSENRITPINTTVDSPHLPLLGCGLTTVFGSLCNEVSMSVGDSVLILGVGAIGSISIIASKSRGAGEIVAVDNKKDKANLAKSLGTDIFYLVDSINTEEKFKEMKDRGKLFDLVIDTTGDSNLMSRSYELLGSSGTLLIIGVMPHDQMLKINTLGLNLGKKIVGTQGGKSKPHIDIPKLVTAIEKKLIPIENLFFKVRNLTEINQSISEIRNGTPLKQYINMF